jgi:SH3 domain protein
MRILTTLFLLLVVGSSVAAPRYVSDQLNITLRKGPGNQYQILKTLSSGTRLELVEDQGEHLLVRTEDGLEGWVRNQYMLEEPTAALKLEGAERKIERLTGDVRSLKERLAASESQRRELSGQVATLSRDKGGLETLLAELREAAAEPLRLREENGTLHDRVAALEVERDRLTGENGHLRDSAQREWFITGAAVLGGGILLGLVLPLLRRKRKSSWDFR